MVVANAIAISYMQMRAVVLSSINSLSVKFATRVALIFTIAKVSALVIVIVLGFYHLIFTGTAYCIGTQLAPSNCSLDST